MEEARTSWPRPSTSAAACLQGAMLSREQSKRGRAGCTLKNIFSGVKWEKAGVGRAAAGRSKALTSDELALRETGEAKAKASSSIARFVGRPNDEMDVGRKGKKPTLDVMSKIFLGGLTPEPPRTV